MDINKEKTEEKTKGRGWKKWAIIALLLLFILLIIFLVLRSRGSNNKEEETVIVQEPSTEVISSEDDGESIFDIEEESALPSEEWGADATSENFKINQIRFGGNIALADSQQKDLSLELYEIKSEMVESREDEEPRFLLTWKTNKASISEVVYAKDDGSNPLSVRENSYGFDHSVLLSDIELSTIYVYRIIARDRWGNEKMSDYFSMYTGEKKASIFDLIVSSIEDTFSWAMKK